MILLTLLSVFSNISSPVLARNDDAGTATTFIDEERSIAIGRFAEKFVVEGNKKNLLIYSQRNRNAGYNLRPASNEYGQYGAAEKYNGAPFTNMLAYDCASFVATMYNLTLKMQLTSRKKFYI